MSEHDLQKYKQSKIIVEDLDAVRILLKASYKSLVLYKKYTPIKPILENILEAEIAVKTFLEIHRDNVKNKGRIK